MRRMNHKTDQVPYSESCERNKQVIFDVLAPLLSNACRLLEIGSGTGQHAAWMAKQAPHITWQPSEIQDNLATLKLRLDVEAPDNVSAPIIIDVAEDNWNDHNPDILFTCNTLHIMSEHHVEAFWQHAGALLKTDALVIVYGPFKYFEDFTTASNAKFDVWLKRRDPASGIRDFEWINELADKNHFICMADHAMPANNQCIIWRKILN